MKQSAIIDHDLKCCSCGDNLRGLQEDAVCPECSKSIHATREYWIAKRARTPQVHRWLFAILFGLAHLVLVAAPFIYMKGSGESAGFLVLCADMPLMAIVKWMAPHAFWNMGATKWMYIVAIGGTLMWVGVGAMFDIVGDRYMRSRANQSG